MRKEGRKTNREIRENDCIIKLQLTQMFMTIPSLQVSRTERDQTHWSRDTEEVLRVLSPRRLDVTKPRQW